MAVNQLHIHIMEKFQGIKDLLAYENDDKLALAGELAEAVVSSVTIDSLVIGTLEEAFFEMVQVHDFVFHILPVGGISNKLNSVPYL